MNVLFISTKSPLPTNDGHSLRTFNLLKQIALEHSVHLLTFVKSQEEHNYTSQLKEFCLSVKMIDLPENRSKISFMKTVLFSLLKGKPFVVCKYDNPRMHSSIANVLAHTRIDLVHLDMLPLGVYLKDVEGYKTILDEHNVESALLARRITAEPHIAGKIFFTIQQKWLEKFEKDTVANVNYIIACSELDTSMLRGFGASVPVATIPNGVDTDFFYSRKEIQTENDSLIFVGGLNWYPNRDALQWFDEEILPIILKQNPKTCLHIIGNLVRIKWKHDENIICHGSIEDVRPLMARASAFVVPLRIGGGTRLKILNAMAMGKSVISTSIGAEGLGTSNGVDILIADEAKSFAEKVVLCLNDSITRDKIAKEAEKFVKQNYQWNNIGLRLLTIFQQLAN